LSNTPDLSQGSDQSSGTAQTPGETALLQAQGQQGVTESVVNSTNQVVKNASTDAATLGLSGQIVGLLGTIAGASVAGIAGLLVGPGKTEQPPPPDAAGTRGGEPSPADSPTDLLRKWDDLRNEGTITDSDFDRMKERLLLVASTGGDTTPPQVLSTNPRDKTVNVPPDIRPTATFSKDMDGATINPNTFKLLDQSTGDQVRPVVRNGVVYDESTKSLRQ
jgi:Bacterial Ig-like domain